MQITLIGYGRLNSRLEDHSDRKKPAPKKQDLHIFFLSYPTLKIYLEDTPKPSTWQQDLHSKDVGVSKNNGTPKSSILIGFSSINHPFWGTPIFGNIHVFVQEIISKLTQLFRVSQVLRAHARAVDLFRRKFFRPGMKCFSTRLRDAVHAETAETCMVAEYHVPHTIHVL